jgi:hypothetical protein
VELTTESFGLGEFGELRAQKAGAAPPPERLHGIFYQNRPVGFSTHQHRFCSFANRAEQSLSSSYDFSLSGRSAQYFKRAKWNKVANNMPESKCGCFNYVQRYITAVQKDTYACMRPQLPKIGNRRVLLARGFL